jgi:hypothetical protein
MEPQSGALRLIREHSTVTSWVWGCGNGGEKPGFVRETEHVYLHHQHYYESACKMSEIETFAYKLACLYLVLTHLSLRIRTATTLIGNPNSYTNFLFLSSHIITVHAGHHNTSVSGWRGRLKSEGREGK